MSTNFDKNFGTVSAQHVQQIFQPIEDIESGKSMFRVATSASTADKYVVDFRQSANPGGHRLTGLAEGQLVIFKATLSCNAGADLEVLHDGGTDTVPLTLAGNPVTAGSIAADQILAVIYNSAGSGRFDILGVENSTSTASTITPVLLAKNNSSSSTTHSLTQNVWHDIPFEGILVDGLGGDVTAGTGANLGKFVANTAMTLMFTIDNAIAVSGINQMRLGVFKNGTLDSSSYNYSAHSSVDPAHMSWTYTVTLAPSDVFGFSIVSLNGNTSFSYRFDRLRLSRVA